MSQYRKILLIADPALQQSHALESAVELATSTGAALHIGLFDHSPAIAAVTALSSEVGNTAKWGFIEQRELWLRKQVERLHDQGLSVETHMVYGKPIHECIIEKVVALAPDVVLKDIHHEPLLKRVLLVPLDWLLLRLCPVPLLLVNAAASLHPRRVIAAVDTSRPQQGTEELNDRIVAAALQLAIQCDATLHLVQAFDEIIPMFPGEMGGLEAFGAAYEQLHESHQQGFEKFADRHSVPAAQRHFLRGSRFGALADFVNEAKADVLVMGTTYRTGLSRIVIGSTAERMLNDLRCDVLAIKPAGFMADLDQYLDLDALRDRADIQRLEPAEVGGA